MKRTLKKILKIFLYITAAVVLGLLVYYTIPILKLLYTEEGRAVISDTVKSYGKFAPIIVVFIEVLQIVAAFIPGAPVDIMSGVLFGGFLGMALCLTGALIGTVIVYYLVRKFGKPLVFKFFPEEKFNAVKILNDDKKLTFTIFLLFLIPGTPKDFLTYIAGLTKINPYKFFAISLIARSPAMACSVFMGDSIGKGRFLVGFIILLAVVLITVIVYFLKDKILGDKVHLLNHKKNKKSDQTLLSENTSDIGDTADDD